MNFVRAAKALLDRRAPAAYAVLMGLRDRLAFVRGEPELRLLPTLVDPLRRAVDVGASNGLYSFWLLRHARTVLAFEPNPGRLPLLRSRFAREAKAGRYLLRAVAASDREGTATLSAPVGAQGLASLEVRSNGAPTHEVALRRMDDFDDTSVGFIKIDVEGHEAEALRGGLKLIARDRPCILVEAEERHRPGSLAAIRDMLEPLNYRGFFLGPAGLSPITLFDAGRHQSAAALSADGTHRRAGQAYVNNFIFVPDDEVATRLSRAAGR
jgi:FkbM family methyltransferase